MARGAYIGINTEVPAYEYQTGTVNLTALNLSEYFEVENGTYYFAGEKSTFETNLPNGSNANNQNITATSVWTAKSDMTDVSFSYRVAGFGGSGASSSADALTIKVGNVIVANAINPHQNGTWSGSILTGEKIELTYSTCSSTGNAERYAYLKDMTFTGKIKVQAGTTIKSVARKIKNGYIGINTELPIYGESTGTINLTASNISEYFEVENGTYYFMGVGNESAFTSNNSGQKSTTATSVWTAKSDMSDMSFDYSVSSYSINKLTIKVNNVTVANAISGNQNLTWSGSLLAGEKIELSYVRGSYSWGSYNDCGTLSNMTFTGKVKVQIGTEFKDVARRIKKAYIGIGGMARPCWDSEKELAYYGAISDLNYKSTKLTATTFGNYALFVGGGTNAFTSNRNYDTYDKNLTKGSLTGFSTSSHIRSTSIDDYALFDTGSLSEGYYGKVYAYNKVLTLVIPDAFYQARYYVGAATVNNNALFAGGVYDDDDSLADIYANNVDSYDSNLTRSTLTGLSTSRELTVGISFGNYALFAGGQNSDGVVNAVDAYDENLTRSKPTALSAARVHLAATTIGNYAIFAGGTSTRSTLGQISNTITALDVVDAYDENLTHSNPSSLSEIKCGLAATTINDNALFSGGYNGTTNDSGGKGKTLNSTDIYDENLTKTPTTPISTARVFLAATTIGNYALFGGGQAASNSDYLATVEAYTMAYK